MKCPSRVHRHTSSGNTRRQTQETETQFTQCCWPFISLLNCFNTCN